MRQRIEARVLDALRERMLTPELVEEFVRTFNAEIAKAQHRAVTDQASVAKELDKVERRLAGVLRAIEDGAWNESLRSRLTELEKAKAALTVKMEAAEAPAPQVHLHPNTPRACIGTRSRTFRPRSTHQTSAWRRPRRYGS